MTPVFRYFYETLRPPCKILVRVCWASGLPDLIMHVRSCRIACGANVPQHLTSPDLLTDPDCNHFIMGIKSGEAEPVLDDNKISASTAPASKTDNSVSCGLHWHTGLSSYVYSAVEFILSGSGMLPFSILRRYMSINRPPLGS